MYVPIAERQCSCQVDRLATKAFVTRRIGIWAVASRAARFATGSACDADTGSNIKPTDFAYSDPVKTFPSLACPSSGGPKCVEQDFEPAAIRIGIHALRSGR